jgi:hypothetical protein
MTSQVRMTIVIRTGVGNTPKVTPDRGVVVRALRNTKPDAMVFGKPQWKVATATRALERHNRGGGGDGLSPPEYAAFDRAYEEMKALPTLAARRRDAVKLVPLIDDMMVAMRAHVPSSWLGTAPASVRLREIGSKSANFTLRLTYGLAWPCLRNVARPCR